MLTAILKNIGLSEKDAEVYLACLELGTQPASIIAKKAGLKRPTTYLILEGLAKKGLVSEFSGSNVKYFTAVSPDYLLHFIEKQKRELTHHQHELEAYLPELNSLTNPYSLNPKVRFYDGFDGVERVMNDTLTSSEPLCAYVNMESWFSRPETREYILWYGIQRVQKKRLAERCVAIDNDISRKYLEDEYPEVRTSKLSHFRWMPKDIAGVTNEINIYEDKVAIVSISPNELMGVLIESQSIAQTQKALFELAWRGALPAAWELAAAANPKKKTS
ncbi:hypothetical protein CO046_05095 [Candidatus Peregrinibacteria bacterium CG_4_9_14_0_2_um_filter_53_11]|nr:MAG: hypothetical protein CO046_05095 [Candidatus Peregrinibacteria bacterium CG_4_9_14_0_2_um_filter_53_11]